jgi:hypothetical protein
MLSPWCCFRPGDGVTRRTLSPESQAGSARMVTRLKDTTTSHTDRRGTIDILPSGSLRVRVYAGLTPRHETTTLPVGDCPTRA